MIRVCILDYGSGNVKSVYNLFATLTEQVGVANEPREISKATHIVLPGVGAFGAAMKKMQEKLPLDILEQAVFHDKKPFLGICVGMQVLATYGLEFGKHAGLGWIAGCVDRLVAPGLPLPHIGWNNTTIKQPSPLLKGLEHDADFYFVHSFVFRPEEDQRVVATTVYGEEFCSVIQKDNLYGVQFHPEKSQRTGKRLVQNFMELS